MYWQLLFATDTAIQSSPHPENECQRFSASHLGYFMFQLVAYIHLSNICSLYWQKQQHNAPCRILKMSVNGESTVLVVAYLVIKSSR